MSLGVGPIGGVNLGNATIEGHSNTSMRTGLAMGVRAELGVTNPYSLMIEPTYVKKGADFTYGGGLLPEIKASGELDYIEIPLLVKAKFGSQQMHLFVFAGPSLDINLNAKGSIGSFSNTFEKEPAPLVFSGDIGGGLAYQLQRFVYLTADARYDYGFSNALKNPVGDIDSWKSRDIRMMLGVLVHLTE